MCRGQKYSALTKVKTHCGLSQELPTSAKAGCDCSSVQAVEREVFSVHHLQPRCTKAATVRLRSLPPPREQTSSPGNAGPCLCPPRRMRLPSRTSGLRRQFRMQLAWSVLRDPVLQTRWTIRKL